MVNDFILSEFNTEIIMDISGAFDTYTYNIGSYDAMVQININKNDWSACFKITGDSVDINNVDASDIKYYVYNTSNTAGLEASYNNIISTISIGSILLDGNPSTAVVTNIPILSDTIHNELQYDFVRHIALDLFNSLNGVDLFLNETELRRSIEIACDKGANNLLGKISTILSSSQNNGPMINGQSGNLTYTLIRQLFAKQPQRFSGIAGDGYDAFILSDTIPTELPWVIGDNILYTLTLNAAVNQHLLVRDTISVLPRKYLIKMVLSANNV